MLKFLWYMYNHKKKEHYKTEYRIFCVMLFDFVLVTIEEYGLLRKLC